MGNVIVGYHSLYNMQQVIGTCFFLFLAEQPITGYGLLIHEVSRSHTTTRHSR